MKQLTEQQKKVIYIVIAVLLAIHFLPRFLHQFRKPTPPSPPPVRVAPPQPPSPPPPPSPEAVALAKYGGIWVGNALMPNQYRCDIRVEIRKGDDILSQIKGYETKRCIPVQPFAGGSLKKDSIGDVMRLTAPISAVMTGTPQTGGIRFTIDQTIGSPADGCVLSSFTMTDFGLGEVQAEWKENPSCSGGRMVLRKARG